MGWLSIRLLDSDISLLCVKGEGGLSPDLLGLKDESITVLTEFGDFSGPRALFCALSGLADWTGTPPDQRAAPLHDFWVSSRMIT
jgi:hypothetical protein